MDKKTLLKTIFELEEQITLIEEEIEYSKDNPFSMMFSYSQKTFPCKLLPKFRKKHRQNKVRLAKQVLSYTKATKKQFEQDLKKLL